MPQAVLASEFAHYIATLAPRDTPWPLVYDEMCRVARSRAFRGMGYDELAAAGISLSIMGTARLCQLLEQAWDQQEDPQELAPSLVPAATGRAFSGQSA
jgi:hypothetical protein